MNQTSRTPMTFPPLMYPIQSTKEYKLGTQKPKPQKQSFIHGTSEGVLLQKQLLKECMNTSHLIQKLNSLQNHQKRKREREPHTKTHKKRTKKSRVISRHSAKKIPCQSKQTTYSSSSTSSRNTSSNSSTASSSSS